MNAHSKSQKQWNVGPWGTPTAGLESALFVGVQAVMVLCVVLVAAQALAV